MPPLRYPERIPGIGVRCVARAEARRSGCYRNRFLAFVSPLLALGASSSLGQQPSAIIAGRCVAPDGTLKADVAIVLSSGKIKALRAGADYAGGGEVVLHPDAVVCPGLIDVRSTIGAYGNNVETASAIDPGASAVDTLDPHHRDFRSALRGGITTAMIAPATTNLISGAAVVVKTGGPSTKSAVLRTDGPLMFALGSGVQRFDRVPTSRLGAASMLRDALDSAARGEGHARLVAFAHGRLDGVVFCEEPEDVDTALRLFGRLDRSVTLMHTSDAHELAADAAGHVGVVVIGPLDFGMSSRTLSSPVAFAGAEVSVAFAGDTPRHGRDALRVTAALAVRYGMDAAAARRAISSAPAAVAGVSDRVGAIKPGLDADLVVFSDDPLRLDARVLEVYIDGTRVYNATLDPEFVSGDQP